MDKLSELRELYASLQAELQAVPPGEPYQEARSKLQARADTLAEMIRTEERRLERARLAEQAEALKAQAAGLVRGVESVQLTAAVKLFEQAEALYQEAGDSAAAAAARAQLLQVQRAIEGLDDVQALSEKAAEELRRLEEQEQVGPLDTRLLSNRLALALIWLGQAQAIHPDSELLDGQVRGARQQSIRLGWTDERFVAYLQNARLRRLTPEQIDLNYGEQDALAGIERGLGQRIVELGAILDQAHTQLAGRVERVERRTWAQWLAVALSLVGLLIFAILWAWPVPTPLSALRASETPTSTASQPPAAETEIPETPPPSAPPEGPKVIVQTVVVTNTVVVTQTMIVTNTVVPATALGMELEFIGNISPNRNIPVYSTTLGSEAVKIGFFLSGKVYSVQILETVKSVDGLTWYKVSGSGTGNNGSTPIDPLVGFVKSEFVDLASGLLALTPTSVGQAAGAPIMGKVTAPEGLMIRQAAGAGGAEIDGLQFDAEVQILGKVLDAADLTWYKVIATGITGVKIEGFVAAQFIEVIGGAEVPTLAP